MLEIVKLLHWSEVITVIVLGYILIMLMTRK
jgi:hypothetical protein